MGDCGDAGKTIDIVAKAKCVGLDLMGAGQKLCTFEVESALDFIRKEDNYPASILRTPEAQYNVRFCVVLPIDRPVSLGTKLVLLIRDVA